MRVVEYKTRNFIFQEDLPCQPSFNPSVTHLFLSHRKRDSQCTLPWYDAFMNTTDQSGTSTSPVVRDREFEHHLAALGFSTVEEYLQWCQQHGFAVRADKHWHQRCKERYFALQQEIHSRSVRKKRESRHPRAAIQAIADRELAASDLISPYLILISDAFASLAGSTRDAFLRLLLHVQGCTNLLSVEPVVRQFGTQPGNNFVDALAALARRHDSWQRPIEAWNPQTHNPRRQFSLLARHLLAKYPVPVFLDSVWFKGQTPEGLRQQQWFWQIGNGTSPRQLELPIRFTKRMVHHFLRAPSDYTVEAAFRWAQVLALGGTVRLVEAVLGSKLATDFSHEEFWESVIRWLVANPMLDTAQVGPVVDYIHHQKFEAQQAEPNARPFQSGFSIHGRTPQAILRQMREWYGELRKEPQQQTQVTWYESGIGEFEWIEGAATPENRQHWTIKEILTRKDLFGEGSAMRHCVASYEHSCASGQTSIWSMGMERREGRRKRVLTVEVAADRKTICQVRGKANRLPTAKEMDILRRWVGQEGLTVADGVRSR